MPVLFGGHNLVSLVEIGLTDLDLPNLGIPFCTRFSYLEGEESELPAK